MPFGSNPLVPVLTALFIKDVDVYVQCTYSVKMRTYVH